MISQKFNQTIAWQKALPLQAGLGAPKPRSEAHLQVRRDHEVAAQRRRWIIYETIFFILAQSTGVSRKSPASLPYFLIF